MHASRKRTAAQGPCFQERSSQRFIHPSDCRSARTIHRRSSSGRSYSKALLVFSARAALAALSPGASMVGTRSTGGRRGLVALCLHGTSMVVPEARADVAALSPAVLLWKYLKHARFSHCLPRPCTLRGHQLIVRKANDLRMTASSSLGAKMSPPFGLCLEGSSRIWYAALVPSGNDFFIYKHWTTEPAFHSAPQLHSTLVPTANRSLMVGMSTMRIDM